MEPLFVNRYTGTYKMLVEFGRKHAIGPRYWTFVLIPFIVAIGLWYGLAEGAWGMTAAWSVFLLIYFMPHYYAWSVLRNSKRLNDGLTPEAVISFGDTIELEEGVSRITVHYHSITRVLRLKHSYMLMTSRRTGVMLRTDGFTKGTFHEFKQFLREKRPDLNIPD